MKYFIQRVEDGQITVFPTLEEREEFKKRHNDDGYTYTDDVKFSDSRFNHFSSYWDKDKGKYELDFNKAKEETLMKIRSIRFNRMNELDVQFMRALETGLNTTEIVKEKQRLRDITTLIDNATSVEELLSITI